MCPRPPEWLCSPRERSRSPWKGDSSGHPQSQPALNLKYSSFTSRPLTAPGLSTGLPLFLSRKWCMKYHPEIREEQEERESGKDWGAQEVSPCWGLQSYADVQISHLVGETWLSVRHQAWFVKLSVTAVNYKVTVWTGQGLGGFPQNENSDKEMPASSRNIGILNNTAVDQDPKATPGSPLSSSLSHPHLLLLLPLPSYLLLPVLRDFENWRRSGR